jgi:hypothetical protein
MTYRSSYRSKRSVATVAGERKRSVATPYKGGLLRYAFSLSLPSLLGLDATVWRVPCES